MLSPENNEASWVSDLREMIVKSHALLQYISNNNSNTFLIKDWMIQSDELSLNNNTNIFRKTINEISFIECEMATPK